MQAYLNADNCLRQYGTNGTDNQTRLFIDAIYRAQNDGRYKDWIIRDYCPDAYACDNAGFKRSTSGPS